jgi:hypothetical protein
VTGAQVIPLHFGTVLDDLTVDLTPSGEISRPYNYVRPDDTSILACVVPKLQICNAGEQTAECVRRVQRPEARRAAPCPYPFPAQAVAFLILASVPAAHSAWRLPALSHTRGIQDNRLLLTADKEPVVNQFPDHRGL